MKQAVQKRTNLKRPPSQMIDDDGEKSYIPNQQNNAGEGQQVEKKIKHAAQLKVYNFLEKFKNV